MGRRKTKPVASRKHKSAGQASVLPALSSLTDLPEYSDLVPSAAQEAAFEAWRAAHPEVADPLALACVCRLDRGFPAILYPEGVVRAEHAVHLAEKDAVKPAVGDWVVARFPDEHGMAVIEEVLPRFSDLARWRGSNRGERQTLAANLNIVLIAQAVSDRRVSVDRIARSAVIAADCGCSYAVVLTKADRATSPEALSEDVVRIREVLGDEVAIAVCASKHQNTQAVEERFAAARAAGARTGIEAVRELVPPLETGLVLGESGVGKSTLLNRLLGREALETGEVRTKDDQGRHTTVTRRMVKLEDAGVIIDAPGLRSLPLLGHEEGLALVFGELVEAAGECKFRDCTHTHEPGCAVLSRYGAGQIPELRLKTYLSLAKEMRESAKSLDPDILV
jgi:ribosome biogenesis GTPase